jgi:hypothetical protein
MSVLDQFSHFQNFGGDYAHLNFIGSDKECSFNLKDLNARFDPIKTHYLVYADDPGDFNSPGDKNKIKSKEDKIKILKNILEVKLAPYSANAWVFKVVTRIGIN